MSEREERDVFFELEKALSEAEEETLLENGEDEEEGEGGSPEPRERAKVEVHSWDEPDKMDQFGELVRNMAREDGKVIVYRYDKAGKREYMCQVAAEIWSLDWVQKNMGGGKYQFHVQNGKGKYQGAITAELHGKPRPFDPSGEEEEEEAEELRRMRQILERLEGGAPGGTSSMEMFKMVLSMVTLMTNQQKPWIEALLNRQDDRSSIGELKELLEFVRDVAPEGGGGDPFKNMAAPLIPPLIQALTQGGMMPHVPGGAPPPGTPGPTPGYPPNPSAPPPGAEWAALIQPHLPTLQQWAVQKKPPGPLAGFVAHMLPDQHLSLILEQMGRGEEFLLEFFVLFPETRHHEAWYREFWSELAGEFEWTDAEEVEETDAEPSG